MFYYGNRNRVFVFFTVFLILISLSSFCSVVPWTKRTGHYFFDSLGRKPILSCQGIKQLNAEHYILATKKGIGTLDVPVTRCPDIDDNYKPVAYPENTVFDSGNMKLCNVPGAGWYVAGIKDEQLKIFRFKAGGTADAPAIIFKPLPSDISRQLENIDHDEKLIALLNDNNGHILAITDQLLYVFELTTLKYIKTIKLPMSPEAAEVVDSKTDDGYDINVIFGRINSNGNIDIQNCRFNTDYSTKICENKKTIEVSPDAKTIAFKTSIVGGSLGNNSSSERFILGAYLSDNENHNYLRTQVIGVGDDGKLIIGKRDYIGFPYWFSIGHLYMIDKTRVSDDKTSFKKEIWTLCTADEYNATYAELLKMECFYGKKSGSPVKKEKNELYGANDNGIIPAKVLAKYAKPIGIIYGAPPAPYKKGLLDSEKTRKEMYKNALRFAIHINFGTVFSEDNSKESSETFGISAGISDDIKTGFSLEKSIKNTFSVETETEKYFCPTNPHKEEYDDYMGTLILEIPSSLTFQDYDYYPYKGTSFDGNKEENQQLLIQYNNFEIKTCSFDMRTMTCSDPDEAPFNVFLNPDSKATPAPHQFYLDYLVDNCTYENYISNATIDIPNDTTFSCIASFNWDSYTETDIKIKSEEVASHSGEIFAGEGINIPFENIQIGIEDTFAWSSTTTIAKDTKWGITAGDMNKYLRSDPGKYQITAMVLEGTNVAPNRRFWISDTSKKCGYTPWCLTYTVNKDTFNI